MYYLMRFFIIYLIVTFSYQYTVAMDPEGEEAISRKNLAALQENSEAREPVHACWSTLPTDLRMRLLFDFLPTMGLLTCAAVNREVGHTLGETSEDSDAPTSSTQGILRNRLVCPPPWPRATELFNRCAHDPQSCRNTHAPLFWVMPVELSRFIEHWITRQEGFYTHFLMTFCQIFWQKSRQHEIPCTQQYEKPSKILSVLPMTGAFSPESLKPNKYANPLHTHGSVESAWQKTLRKWIARPLRNHNTMARTSLESYERL